VEFTDAAEVVSVFL